MKPSEQRIEAVKIVKIARDVHGVAKAGELLGVAASTITRITQRPEEMSDATMARILSSGIQLNRFNRAASDDEAKEAAEG